MEYRKCKTCCVEKPLTLEYFRQGKNKRDGVSIPYWYRSCNICTNKRAVVKNHRYKQKHRKELAAAQKIYHQNHKEEDAKTKQVCYQKNKEHYLGKARIWISDRRHNDPSFKLRSIVSNAIFTAIKRNGSRKSGSILDFFPSIIPELKTHLENLWEPWMNWGNYPSFARIPRPSGRG